MLKTMVIFGTRPEAIKLAPVIKELEKHKGQIETFVVVTAQHREMMDQVLNLFDIIPDYDLNLMQTDQSLSDVMAGAIKGIEKLLIEIKPNIILVQGDTTTTFASSLAAFYQKIKIGHVEAGLRTKHKYQPFPEEINRRLTSHIADIHFAPTWTAKRNLISEGISEGEIFVTGNTVIDAMLTVVRNQKSDVKQKNLDKYFKDSWNLTLSNDNQKLILVTGHRRENFGQGLENICHALKEIAINNSSDVEVVYPVHLNPNVQEPVNRILSEIENIHLIRPLDYGPFVYLMARSYLILTDSGGIQEEAPSLGKPVLVMREVTERLEAIEAGTVKLVGSDKDKIVKETQLLLDKKHEYEKMARSINPYGNGKAAERIVNRCLDYADRYCNKC